MMGKCSAFSVLSLNTQAHTLEVQDNWIHAFWIYDLIQKHLIWKVLAWCDITRYSDNNAALHTHTKWCWKKKLYIVIRLLFFCTSLYFICISRNTGWNLSWHQTMRHHSLQVNDWALHTQNITSIDETNWRRKANCKDCYVYIFHLCCCREKKSECVCVCVPLCGAFGLQILFWIQSALAIIKYAKRMKCYGKLLIFYKFIVLFIQIAIVRACLCVCVWPFLSGLSCVSMWISSYILTRSSFIQLLACMFAYNFNMSPEIKKIDSSSTKKIDSHKSKAYKQKLRSKWFDDW